MSVTYKLVSAVGNPITIKKPNTYGEATASQVPNLRCPHCMHMGAFTKALSKDLTVAHITQRHNIPTITGHSTVGIRTCPNPDCLGVVFVVIDGTGKVISQPTEVLDFNPTDIPPSIVASLEEAVKCHSGQCYKASALMVRRVLEELCEDREVTGNNLKDRLIALAGKIVIPKELLDAADHLRLLGNDAAHIEAKTYQTIGEPEVRLAIELTKELLKSAYQYKGLLGQLTALQKPA